MKIDRELIPYIKDILFELKCNKLRVKKIWSDQGDFITKETKNDNPVWYRDLCSLYLRETKRFKKNPRTIIKRQYIIKVLGYLIKYGESKSKYVCYIIEEAERRKAEMENLSEEGYREYEKAMSTPFGSFSKE